jgi:hypothetical protein
MLESVPKTPNMPEYVEVVKTNVQDEGDTVRFDFEIASALEPEKMEAYIGRPEGTMWKVVMDKLCEKGWVSADGQIPLVPMTTHTDVSDDKKKWSFSYKRLDADAPLDLEEN